MLRTIHSLLLILAAVTVPGHAREWTDLTGKYTVKADLVAQNATTVVLKKDDNQLVAVPLEKLSVQDQQYLKSQEVAEKAHKMAGAVQTWNMRDGWKIVGKVVDYARRDVTVQRLHGKLYVNDQPFDNLPKPYQAILPHIVSHFEHIQVENEADLAAWVLKYKGEPHKFTCEGVVLKLADGSELDVPFFLFSEADLKVLQPGWKRWVTAADDKAKQEQQAFLLKSQAAAYKHDQKVNKQIAQMRLEIEAYNSGLFDYWEVTMMPGASVDNRPMVVVVPARDSRSAAAVAAQRFPGYVPGAITRVTRQ